MSEKPDLLRYPKFPISVNGSKTPLNDFDFSIISAIPEVHGRPVSQSIYSVIITSTYSVSTIVSVIKLSI